MEMETGRIGKTVQKWNSQVWVKVRYKISSYVTGH